jgi:hypothetical protein
MATSPASDGSPIEITPAGGITLGPEPLALHEGHVTLVWGDACQASSFMASSPCLTKLATISSFADLTLIGRPCSQRQAMSVGRIVLPYGQPATSPRGARHRARRSRHDLVFGRSAGIGTMMQSCASAAKLQGGGPILHSGLEAMGYIGSPPPRIVIGSPSHGPPRRLSSCPQSVHSLMTPDVGRRPAAPRRSQQDARGR